MVNFFVQRDPASPGCAGIKARMVRCGVGVLRGCVVCTVVVLLAALGGVAGADEIKLGGFWIKDVSIHSIEDGQVLYFNRVGTEFTRPLGGVEGLNLSAYPQLAQAQQAIAGGDDRTAMALLQEVWGKARTDWLRQWVSYLLMGVYDRLELPYEAVDTYLTLIREEAPSFYLAQPPVDSLAGADDEVKRQLQERIESIAGDVSSPTGAAGIAELLALVRTESASAEDGLAIELAGNGIPSPDPVPTTAVLPRNDKKTPENVGDPRDDRPSSTGPMLAQVMTVDDTVTQMLMYSRYDQAVARTEKLLENSNRQMPMRLYQRGIALKGLAEESGDVDHYMDAGLSFMSVVAYFPGSSFAGPSLVEAGIVHSKIGRSDIAKTLYEKAEMVVDAEDEPRYAAKIKQLLGETPN